MKQYGQNGFWVFAFCFLPICADLKLGPKRRCGAPGVGKDAETRLPEPGRGELSTKRSDSACAGAWEPPGAPVAPWCRAAPLPTHTLTLPPSSSLPCFTAFTAMVAVCQDVRAGPRIYFQAPSPRSEADDEGGDCTAHSESSAGRAVPAEPRCLVNSC